MATDAENRNAPGAEPRQPPTSTPLQAVWIPVAVAIIGALASVAAAYVSKKTAEDTATEVVAASIVPIGTVISSVLPPGEFYRQAKITGATFDAEKYTWALADGRDVTRSKYEQLLRATTVPDLRGLFLRGINEARADDRRDPEGQGRHPGDYQADSVVSHGHALSPRIAELALNVGFGGYPEHVVGAHAANGTTVTPALYGGAETRPRNAAVYWYIRIN